jgi:hypothetical protein
MTSLNHFLKDPFQKVNDHAAILLFMDFANLKEKDANSIITYKPH